MDREETIKIIAKRFKGDIVKAEAFYNKIIVQQEERKRKDEEKEKKDMEDIQKLMIPKDNLIDGKVYSTLPKFNRYTRCVQRARWDKTKGVFVYRRYKFGHNFEDEMKHFIDVAESNEAGFIPTKEE